MRSSVRGLTTAALALSTALCVTVAGPHRAYAAPGSTASQADSTLAITVLSPTPHTSFSGNKPIEVSAFYQGTDTNEIGSLELYVDGVNAFTKRLDSPEARGVISFLIDTSNLSAGAHAIVVRAVATDAEVVSAKTSFIYVAEQPAAAPSDTQIDTSAAPSADSSSLPTLSYLTPKTDEQVQGTVRISLKASEADGKSPYVSLFIDRTFKTLRNYAPYEYDWDTTAYSNGYHTIEAYGYDENQNVGPAQVIRVYVNNPGGRTEVRTDLKDGIPAKGAQPVKPQPHKSVSRFSPYIPTGTAATKAIHNAVPTVPIPDAPALAESNGLKPTVRRSSPLKPLQTAKLDAISTRFESNTEGLSDPFVTTSGTSVGSKSIGPARRPSPRMAMLDSTQPVQMHAVMLAKRMNVLDETGGLHSDNDLSDPFIPDTATPKPATHAAATPTTGFKPMPAPTVAPALAKAPSSSAPAKSKPALITRDAHTVPAHIADPAIVQPVVDLGIKTTSLETAVPTVTRPKAVAVHTPAVAQPKAVAVHAPVVAQPKPVTVHTPIIAQPKAVVVHAPVVAQPKAVAVHTPVVAQPKTVAVHTPVVAQPKAVAVHVSAIPVTHRVAVHTLSGAADLMRAKGEMKVLYNHTSLMLDRPITPRAGVMFSPLRQIFEFQGGSLTWSRKTGEVHAKSDDKNILLHIGDKNATINSEPTTLEMAPYLDEGRTMVPLSFLPMALDVNVQFDQASGHLLITTKN